MTDHSPEAIADTRRPKFNEALERVRRDYLEVIAHRGFHPNYAEDFDKSVPREMSLNLAATREALEALLLRVGHVEWEADDAKNVADHLLAPGGPIQLVSGVQAAVPSTLCDLHSALFICTRTDGHDGEHVLAAHTHRQPMKRLTASQRASLQDFAAWRIQQVWDDAGAVTAEVLAENIVTAQEFAIMQWSPPLEGTP